MMARVPLPRLRLTITIPGTGDREHADLLARVELLDRPGDREVAVGLAPGRDRAGALADRIRDQRAAVVLDEVHQHVLGAADLRADRVRHARGDAGHVLLV